MERIGTVRKVGYAMDDEENEEGVRCIAVSIPDYHKEPVYALSISAPVSRMTDTRIAELALDVLAFKKELEKTMEKEDLEEPALKEEAIRQILEEFLA